MCCQSIEMRFTHAAETTVTDEGILIRANIRLLPSAESGRTAPVMGSYRPNHNFFEPDGRNMTIGYIEIPEGKLLYPGESIDVPVLLWKWPGLESGIYPGRQWRIQEGNQLIGIGTVLEVLSGA